jgi:hypothetical protein
VFDNEHLAMNMGRYGDLECALDRLAPPSPASPFRCTGLEIPLLEERPVTDQS